MITAGHDVRESARQNEGQRVLAWDIDAKRWVIVSWTEGFSEWHCDRYGEDMAWFYEDAELADFRDLPPPSK